MDRSMNIGQAAKASGVSAKMIRHYERVGLFPQAARTDAGYRQYGEKDVHTLRFIRELLNLWQNRRRPSRQVKALAEAHIQQLEQKAQELLSMKSTLELLAQRCHGDDRPQCPIIDTLADPGGAAVTPLGAHAHARTAGLRAGRSHGGRG